MNKLSTLGLAAGLLAGGVDAQAGDLTKRDLKKPVVFLCEDTNNCEPQFPARIGELRRQYEREVKQMARCEAGKVKVCVPFPDHGTYLKGDHTHLAVYLPDGEEGSLFAEDRSGAPSGTVATEVLGTQAMHLFCDNEFKKLPIFVVNLHHHANSWGEFNLIVETDGNKYPFPFTYEAESPKVSVTEVNSL